MKYMLFVAISLFSFNAVADIAVIVNKNNNNQVDINEVRLLFLAKKKYFDDGMAVKNYNFTGNEKDTQLFNEQVLRKSGSRLNSYWARMLFSSRGAPPMNIISAEDIKRRVAEEKNALSFINAADVDDSVKTLFVVEQVK